MVSFCDVGSHAALLPHSTLRGRRGARTVIEGLCSQAQQTGGWCGGRFRAQKGVLRVTQRRIGGRETSAEAVRGYTDQKSFLDRTGMPSKGRPLSTSRTTIKINHNRDLGGGEPSLCGLPLLPWRRGALPGGTKGSPPRRDVRPYGWGVSGRPEKDRQIKIRGVEEATLKSREGEGWPP